MTWELAPSAAAAVMTGTGPGGYSAALAAASASHVHIHSGGVAVAVAVLAALWLLRAWLWPYAPCRRCKGTGKNAGSTGRRFGTHRRCKGTGRRVRLGARTVHRVILRKDL
jgi:hypothetical protein